MLGSIRFFLAFFVLLSHIPNNGMKLNLGVVSVICFYFISGYLMRKSYARFIVNSNKPALDFYIDRIIKLFPQYVLVVLITFVSIWYFGKSDAIKILNQDITLSKILVNLTLLPANYVFQPFVIDILKPHPIVPPAWSLATEFQFYLLLPLIFTLNKKYLLLLLMTTLVIQFSSFFFASGAFNSNSFGYRYIFGVLTVFLFGFSFAEKGDIFYKRISIFIWLVFTVFLFIISPAFNLWKNPYVQEVLFGGFLALPLGYYFITIKMHINYKRLDNFLGDLAYPMFISHFLSFYLVEKLFDIPVEYRVVYYILSISLCFFISFLLSLFQKKVEIYRIKRRGFSSLKSSKTMS